MYNPLNVQFKINQQKRSLNLKQPLNNNKKNPSQDLLQANNSSKQVWI